MSEQKMYAYFSKKVYDLFGYIIYENESGQMVQCTAIYDSVESAEENYLWSDKIFVGEVVKFVRNYDSGKYFNLRSILYE